MNDFVELFPCLHVVVDLTLVAGANALGAAVAEIEVDSVTGQLVDIESADTLGVETACDSQRSVVVVVDKESSYSCTCDERLVLGASKDGNL